VVEKSAKTGARRGIVEENKAAVRGMALSPPFNSLHSTNLRTTQTARSTAHELTRPLHAIPWSVSLPHRLPAMMPCRGVRRCFSVILSGSFFAIAWNIAALAAAGDVACLEIRPEKAPALAAAAGTCGLKLIAGPTEATAPLRPWSSGSSATAAA